jgi:sporulation protein YlmC with PRC-barrel domain
MKKVCLVLTAAALLSTAVFAQSMAAGRAEIMSTVPTSARTVSDWYKQDIYDPSDSKIGKIDDVLVSDNGQVNALMVGVGGFLGAGEKDVAVPFDAVKQTTKNNKMYLTIDTTKDALKSAPSFKYDSDETSWVPDRSK